MTRPPSLLHWVFPAMLVVAALSVLLSDRNLSQAFAELQVQAEPVAHPAVAWAQRLVSLLLLGIAAERIGSHIVSPRRLPSPVLACAFILYWLTTVAAPAAFGAHPRLAHEYLYTLVIGLA